MSPAALGSLIEVFEENFRRRGEIGAAVSVWWRGSEVLSLADGHCNKERSQPWTSDTLVPVYSATKGPAAATLLLVLESRGLGVETAVSEVWPAFPVPAATFGELLSHQCGLAALDEKADIFDHAGVVSAIEAQTPAWHPGNGHGYHPRTFGALLDEPVRRLTGMPLGRYWREQIAGPLDLDFWIGLPESEHHRVARLYPGKAGPDDFASGFYKAFSTEGSLTRRAFNSPTGLRSVQDMNDPRAWTAGLPALGGIGSATALAKFYQAAAGSIPSPLSPTVRAALATRRTDGDDLVLVQPTAFSAGCQLDPLAPDGHKLRAIFGPSSNAFGHPGAGGSHAFADPGHGLSFAYVMNQMELSVMPGRRSTLLVDALYS